MFQNYSNVSMFIHQFINKSSDTFTQFYVNTSTKYQNIRCICIHKQFVNVRIYKCIMGYTIV